MINGTWQLYPRQRISGGVFYRYINSCNSVTLRSTIMIGKLDPEENVMNEPSVLEQINSLIKTLNWETGDDIAVEVGGTSVYEIDGAGTKWAPVKGTRKYNKDAFIVIKNRSRNPTVPSLPNPDLKQQHEFTGGK